MSNDTLVDKLEKLDMTTREGINEAKRLIAEEGRRHSRDDLIQEVKTPLPPADNANSITERITILKNRDDLVDALDVYHERLNPPDRSPASQVKLGNADAVAKIYVQHLIAQLIPQDDLTLFTGRGGYGKSTLALQIACQLAAGHHGSFMDTQGVAPGDTDDFNALVERRWDKTKEDWVPDGSQGPATVIYAFWEDAADIWRRRLLDICNVLSWPDYNSLSQNLHLMDMTGAGPFWGPEHGKHFGTRAHLLDAGHELLPLCEEVLKTDHRPGLLIIDNLTRAFRTPDTDKEAVAEFCTYTQRWAHENHCAVLAIQHPPRSEKDADDAYAGTSAWQGCCRSMFAILEGENISVGFDGANRENISFRKEDKRKEVIKRFEKWAREQKAQDTLPQIDTQTYLYLHHLKASRGEKLPDTPLERQKHAVLFSTNDIGAAAASYSRNTTQEDNTDKADLNAQNSTQEDNANDAADVVF